MSSNATASTGSSGGGSGGGAASAAAAGGAAGPGGAGVPFGPAPDEVMVYWLDIALFCVLGAFFLAFLPRAIGRFSNMSEWSRGLMFRSGPPPDPMVQHISPNDLRLRREDTNTSFSAGESDESHTYADHKQPYAYARSGKEWTTSMPSGKEWASMPSGRDNNSPPTHVRALSTVLHPISRFFSRPSASGSTSGKSLMTFAYIGAILFMALSFGGDPVLKPNRLGYVAVSQLPVAIALGTKNNVVGMLLGMGYERLNFLHRLVGTVVFMTANQHAIGYIFTFLITKNGAMLGQTYIRFGQLALLGITLLFLTASAGVRQGAHTLFLSMHIIGSTLFIVGIWFHQPVCQKYILLSLGIYGFDHLFRIVKTRFATARLSAIPELGITRVELPGIGAGWRAGQHVRLRVLSGKMGVFGWVTAHPFTIASASEVEGKGLVLMCKKVGGWTNKLYAAASQTGTDAYAAEGGYNAHIVRNMKVIVEGPYGGVGNMVLSSYSSVLFIVGGSGLTFALGGMEELVHDIRDGRSAVKFIELVWTTQEKGSLAPMLPAFSSLLDSVANIPGVVMRITVHYTRAVKDSMSAPDGGKSLASLDAHLATLAPSLTLQPGRPSLTRITNSIARLTANIPGARGLAVGVCGPLGLVTESRKAVRAVDAELRGPCGGVEIHEEFFGY